MGRILRRAATLASLGVLLSGGAALAWEGNGNNNGWDNKQERGCPSGYTKVAASVEPLANLNGDQWICSKVAGNSGSNYIDNISNH